MVSAGIEPQLHPGSSTVAHVSRFSRDPEGGAPARFTRRSANASPLGSGAAYVLKDLFRSRILKAVVKAYTIGFIGATLAVLVAAGIWLALQPREEAGLRWGGSVYTSKQEFDVYLRRRG